MRNQSLLVLLLVVVVAVSCHNLPSDNDNKIDEKENEIATDNDKFKVDPKIPKAMDPRFNKMLPMQTEKVQKKPSTTEKAVKDETSTIGKNQILTTQSREIKLLKHCSIRAIQG